MVNDMLHQFAIAKNLVAIPDSTKMLPWHRMAVSKWQSIQRPLVKFFQLWVTNH